MKPVLLDTNAYAAFKRGHADALEILQHASTIALTPTVIGELLGGFAVGQREAQNRRELSIFLESRRVVVLELNVGTAEHYATIYQSLRQSGKPIPTNDMWIAASAKQHEFAIFSYDRHFQAVEGIRVGTRLDDFLE